MGTSTERIKGVMAIVIASFLWGTTGTAASYSANVSPLAIGAFAMGVGGVLLVIMARKALLRDQQRLLGQPKLLLLGGLCVALYPLAFYSSMRLSGVAIGTVVSIASAPLFAVIIERLFSQNKISLQWCVSFVLGALGIALLALGKSAQGGADAAELWQSVGIVLGLVAGLTYAGYSWVAKQLINTGVHSSSAMAGLFGCAALLLLPSLSLSGENLFNGAINSSVAVYMACVPMFLGYLLFGYGLRTVDASDATLITLIEPLIATLFAVYLLGEVLQPLGWLGMALVSVCLFVQSIKFPAKVQPDATYAAEL